MKKIMLSLLALGLITNLGCGKKNYSPASGFDLQPMDISAENTSGGTSITRSDLTSGPTYKMVVSHPSEITKIDKNLVCGPVSMAGRTVLPSDVNAFQIKISDQEFPGLNQLPAAPHCILEVTAENSSGSQFTKKLPLVLKFDTQTFVQIRRLHIERGVSSIVNKDEVPLEQFEIQNPQKFPISFLYKPYNFSADAICLWETQPMIAYGVRKSRSEVFEVRADKIEFNPPTLIPTGNLNVGLHFTVNGGETVVVKTSGKSLPSDCFQSRTFDLQNYIHINVGRAYEIFAFDFHQAEGTLFQQKDFVPSDDDLIHPLDATLTTNASFPAARIDTASRIEIMNYPNH